MHMYLAFNFYKWQRRTVQIKNFEIQQTKNKNPEKFIKMNSNDMGALKQQHPS